MRRPEARQCELYLAREGGGGVEAVGVGRGWGPLMRSASGSRARRVPEGGIMV